MVSKRFSKASPAFWVAARIFLGFVFAYAGFSKLTEPVENFRGVIAEYRVIPYVFIPAVSLVMPWIEFVSGIFAVIGYAPRASSLILAVLCGGFLLVLGSSQLLLDSAPVTCGCFGQGGLHLTVRQVFLLDAVNLAFGLKLYSLRDHPFSLDRLLKK